MFNQNIQMYKGCIWTFLRATVGFLVGSVPSRRRDFAIDWHLFPQLGNKEPQNAENIWLNENKYSKYSLLYLPQMCILPC